VFGIEPDRVTAGTSRGYDVFVHERRRAHPAPHDCLRLPSVRDTDWVEARFGHS
jgi:hypothetical protein